MWPARLDPKGRYLAFLPGAQKIIRRFDPIGQEGPDVGALGLAALKGGPAELATLFEGDFQSERRHGVTNYYPSLGAVDGVTSRTGSRAQPAGTAATYSRPMSTILTCRNAPISRSTDLCDGCEGRVGVSFFPTLFSAAGGRAWCFRGQG